MLCRYFENFLERIFLPLGSFIGRRPTVVICFSLCLTILFSLGLIWFEEVNNVRTEYSPMDSPSRKEYEVSKAFLNQNGTLDPSYIMVLARDSGSLLRDNYRSRLIEFVKTLQNNVSVVFEGKNYTFRDLCEPYCELNTAFLAFLKLYDSTNPSTFTYPQVEIFGTEAFIGNNVYGVELFNNSKQIKSFSTAILPFYLVTSYETSGVIYEWLMEARKAFKLPRFDIFKCEVTGDAMVSAEVRRMGMETAPLIVGSIVAMIIFVIIFSGRRDPSRAKPWESLIGCLIPLLALLSATGILSFFGLKFQSIIVAALFLVLSMGVDDVFIILRAWDRTSVSETVENRMSVTMEEAGPSITISAITNAMSFFIGMTSQTPAVRAFSLYSAVAIVICYFYQLIMFSSVVALSGYREKSGKQSLLCCLKADPQSRSPFVEWIVDKQVRFIRFWSWLLSQWTMRFALVGVMVAYYYVSVVGILQLNTLISIEKMALPDSYLQDFQAHFETSLKNMQPISVFIMNPGDLRNPERLDTIKTIVKEFETATYSYGSESTFFWLQPYEDFLRFYGETDDFTYSEIPTFFKSATYFYLTSFVKYNETACLADDPACITSFFFMTNFHDHIKYHELIPAVTDWRRIASKYSDFQIFAYSDHSPFVDQTLAIDATIWGSVGAALLCTAIACFMFIPNIVCIVAACFSVFSITVGILGLLSLWHIDLDPLSMAALLMAIGFSVDFSSHIAYHFYKSKQPDPVDRVNETLSTIGWPLVQVGLSTIAAVAPLLFKQSYLALVFMKTIFVVCCLGMWHGLVILPVVLMAVTRQRKVATPSDSSSERSSQRSVERKESFYRTQKLINRINQEIWHSKVAPMSPEEACQKPALKHNIALGRTLSTQ
ncbi:unnamed protein product [Auanema sp. JU1783]|nr:unnamed protein product [Auanema sp. JU1783]